MTEKHFYHWDLGGNLETHGKCHCQMFFGFAGCYTSCEEKNSKDLGLQDETNRQLHIHMTDPWDWYSYLHLP